MKLTIASLLLAASSALAAPTNTTTNYLQISDFRARASTVGATMHFVVTDKNYPDDTPTDCNLIWSYGSKPKESARCNNSQYYISFPNGPVDFNRFTLGLERVSGPIPEKGQVLLDSNKSGHAPGTKWICRDDPEPHVLIDCDYEGVLQMQV
ncbi:hypothetical protein ASPWEDRAFT_44386 [Aspergillus wentii DTO 134E9]|uniref:AA1-like domain-containing protein n=1 Tax=Aspergillus wentii DTO 134E9 TaxID=1073089 RepID=A0A1L9RBK5_ASPWE|nr:uncharacterized protein ASPWEDRAFT_44386 [Aspergillus wentii DTO 134E9]KAI9934860.1 hypothetical protein MW887_000480 [Aspergillus wentii]OJJ32299.1 hypothetical protein ASPWEDRAFT_44386 [Aspergillus wentii DTO 134E9]